MKLIWILFTTLFIFHFSPVVADKTPRVLTLLDRYESIFSRLPDWNKKTSKLHPFGNGCTNHNYLLIIGQDQYFVRIGSYTKEVLGLTIAKEQELIALTAKHDISPPVLIADPIQEIMILPFIEAKSVDLHKIEKLSQAIELLKKFHNCNEKLSFTATPEDIIGFYLKQIEKLQITLTQRQTQLIEARPRPIIDQLVPCHMDLKGDNLLDDGKRLWLIDWEYGGMSDPLFDLAQLAPANAFTEDELLIALEIYSPQPSEELKLRFRQFRILADLRIALWCVIQSHTSTLDLPYEEWVEELFTDVENRTEMLR
jgi:thiamine kinase-like enzyme